MATKFDMISQAMTLLDAEVVESWDTSDPSREEEVSQHLYPLAKEALLSQRNWNFAKTHFVLSRITGTPVNPNWDYYFTIPSDCLTLLTVLNSSGSGVDYTIEDNKIYTNTETVIGVYTKNVDESIMPVYFRDALVSRLALDFAEAINGSNTVIQRRAQDFRQKLKAAGRADASANPPVILFNQSGTSWLGRS